MELRVRRGWNERLNTARETYARRTGAGRKPSYEWMAEQVPEVEGEARSASTIRRHHLDPGRIPPARLLADLARALEVRPEWLLEDDGPMTEEMKQRAEQVAGMRGRLDHLVSEAYTLHPAAEALVAEVAQRWLNLPTYCYRDRKRPDLEEVRDEIRELMLEVIQRIPRPGRRPDAKNDIGQFDRPEWERFTVSLLSALWDGLPDPMPESGAWRMIDIDPDTRSWVVDQRSIDASRVEDEEETDG